MKKTPSATNSAENRKATRATQAAEHGVSERTLLRNLARLRAELNLDLEIHAARSLLLGDRCNKLTALSRSDAERTKLRACAITLAHSALAAFGAPDDKTVAEARGMEEAQ